MNDSYRSLDILKRYALLQFQALLFLQKVVRVSLNSSFFLQSNSYRVRIYGHMKNTRIDKLKMLF